MVIMIHFNNNNNNVLGGYIFSNWRRLKEEAGPHILEKCCHGNITNNNYK